MKKRIFSIILAVVTMLSTLPINGLAEGSDSFEVSNEQYIETPAVADGDKPPAIEDENEIMLPETEEEIGPGIDDPGQADPLPETEEEIGPVIDASGQAVPLPETEEEIGPGIDDPEQADPLPETKEETEPLIDDPGQADPLPEIKEETEPGIDDTDISDLEPKTLTQVYEDGIAVSVTDAPEGAVLSVNTPNAEDYADAISAASGTDFIELMALDIRVKTANDMPLNAPVTISVKCDDFSEFPDETVLYHVNNHVAEPVAYTLNKETATIAFCSQEFSPFVLVRPARANGLSLMTPQNDLNSTNFVPVSPDNPYDVQINGSGSVVTIYCLQQKDAWPGGDVSYVPHTDADESYRIEDVNLLTPEEIQILKMVVFAGYPNDSQGILRKHGAASFPVWAGQETNVAIWTLLTEWGKNGSNPDQSYENATPIARELVDYALSHHEVPVPSSSNILIEGSGKLSHINSKWSTGELMITQPAGYDLHFTLNLPGGASAINAAGQTIATVDDGEPFWIVADDPDDLASFDVRVSAVAIYPTDINFFVTKAVSDVLDPVTMAPKNYQTMLYIEKETMDLSGSLSLTKDRVGSISVEKEVTGEGADLSKPFDFTVTLSDTTINGTYGEMTFVSGVAAFTLKHGESKVAQDLPADIQYTVSESEYLHYETTKSNETGTVQDGTLISAKFVNHYKPGSTSVTLGGHKTFNNFPAASEIKPVFTFTLSENGEVIDTKTVEKQGDYAFESITYTEAGVHTYIIAETAGNQSGVIYDTRIYTVTVTVTDDQAGQLVAAISGDTTTGTDLNFTNSYKAAPAEVQFSGLKTLEGRALADKEFSFTLTGADDGISETVKNDADGKISFTKITYTEGGTYAYTVKEEATTEAGVTTDSKIYSITVTVTDDGSGQLRAVIDGDSETGTDLNFANNYKAGSTSVTLGGHKSFNNFPVASEIKPVFTFTLSENGEVIDTKTVEKQGDYAFGSITYTEAGVHTYIIAETAGNQSGVIYDTRIYTVTVTVTDNLQGELVAVISGGSTTGKDLNFTNSYKAAPAEVQFSGLKTLEGRVLADKEFSFTLTGADDGISETVKNDAGGRISFTKITYTEAGVYTYTVKEEATTEAGVTTDSKIYSITVTVTDDGSGQLRAVIDGDSETGTDLNFANNYKAGSTSVTLGGHKSFNNFPAASEIKPVFTFTLSETGEVIDTKTVEKQGDYAFESITYTEAGVHTYIIAETTGNQSGVIYDTETYTVTVTVTDNQQGELVAVISGGSTTGKDLNFTNSYKAAPAEVQFSGLKTLEGRVLADKEFSFTLTGADDGISETVKNDADGKISFTKITYTEAGIYTYTVKEEATTEAGVTTDSKIYNITVTVTDDGSGQLRAVIDGDSETGSDLNFVNRYDPETPKTGDNSNIILLFSFLFVSGFILVVVALYGKKKKAKDN